MGRLYLYVHFPIAAADLEPQGPAPTRVTSSNFFLPVASLCADLENLSGNR